MIREGRRYKRRELKEGQTPPPGFELVSVDDETHTSVGWVPVGDGPEDRWFREARIVGDGADGTFELVGPKAQGGAERMFTAHEMIPHGMIKPTDDPPRTFNGLRNWLAGRDIEGLVFHHPDGRMGKIKLRDFGLKRAQGIDP